MTEQRISNRARLMAIPAVGAVAIGVAAFGKGSSAQNAGATPSASPSPMASPSPATNAAGGAAAGGAGATSLSFTAGDLFFDPKTASAAAGVAVSVTVTNNGALAHDWAIKGQESSAQTKMLNPGDSDTITINLPAGTYQYYCTVPGHAEAGMVGTLTLA